ncbi:MAG: M48 family metalloprotease [Alphaproteobacteria bacterium]
MLRSLSIACFLLVWSISAIASIRDAELEDYLDKVASPLFQASNIEDGGITVTNNLDWNAFVIAGQTVYIHAGLIIDAEGPDMLRGVVAHEIGHITAGHVARRKTFENQTSYLGIAGALLGALGGAVGGGDALGAGLSTGLGLQQSITMAFSRVHESAADQYAIDLLSKTETSPHGLINFLKKLDQRSGRGQQQMAPYLSTHPLTQDRLTLLQRQSAKYLNKKDLEDLQQQHERVVAKLTGFLSEPSAVLRRFSHKEGLQASMARAIAYYRLGQKENSKQELDKIRDGYLSQNPHDGFLWDFLGELHIRIGFNELGCAQMNKAHSFEPQSAMIAFGLAKCGLMNYQLTPSEAIILLNQFERSLSNLGEYWIQLARGYEQLQQRGKAEAATAELLLRQGRRDDAAWFATRALQSLPPQDPWHKRALDIKKILNK